ncbi:TonB-dependent receptor plug domain-containing protein [Salegentibacter sp. F188]|uniref:TonB-dependent receptor plug domain-containing protein n=1 Tax=Autumnicola patrickiae TaxID=3075591 RepID=A0ABU3E0S2_9FLAO|nr:TonB-dependent receptor plug domain-containing protein [Salegentibacter sp. F188]MDT0689568.1 TonB-dependent receptor plug domain-containing protein [Salegentibacter sp. F188]
MEDILIYILKSSGLLAIFFLSYQILLRKETSFRLNRKFLIAGIFTSFILPAIYFTRKVVIEAPVNNAAFSPEMFQNTPVVQQAEINWWNLAGIIYLAGAGIMLFQFMFRLSSILKLIKTHHFEKAEGFKFIKINRDIGPFSFFRYIIYNSSLYSEKDLKLILQHEKVHATQLHSIDVILSHLTTAILWFNPFSWWYKIITEQNLEFLADQETVAFAGSRKAYQHALVKVSVPEFQPALTNHFYQSFIKKRIVMLNKKQNNKPKLWKISLVLPLLIAFMFFFNVKTEAQIVQKEEKRTKILDRSEIKENGEEPLYVLNGVPSKKAIIDTINPKSIEKIDVLKGAKATALYGSSGRDGVILISTKAKSGSAINPLENNSGNAEEASKVSGTVNHSTKLIIVNGEIKEEDFDLDSIDPETIERVEVVKGENAISGYGEKAENGVINVVLKDSEKNFSSEATNISVRKQQNNNIYGTGEKTGDINASENGEQEKPLVTINGKVMPESYDYNDLKPSEVGSINVLKGATATEKYGNKGKDGVIEIFLKGYAGETPHPGESNLWYISAKYNKEALNKTKTALKQKKDINVNFSGIKRNSDGLITSITITAETANGKKASASFNQSEGIPVVVVGLQENGSIIISSNKKDWKNNPSE